MNTTRSRDQERDGAALGPEWEELIQSVRSLGNAGHWVEALADGLERVVRPDVAAVYLSSLDDILAATFAVAPRHGEPIARQLLEHALPALYAASLETPEDWFAGPASRRSNRQRQRLLGDWLLSIGYSALLGGALRSADGMVVGWIAVFSRTPEPARLNQIGEPLRLLCSAAEMTIQSALLVAEKVGARLPKISPRVLSAREREVASLAVRGYSDLNIAAQLQISEGTVGRHLHNIYRKLSVCSRLELSSVFSARSGVSVQRE